MCGLLIARKLKVSQPTASEHLRVLVQAGLIRPKRIKQWTFYRRDEARLRAVKKALAALARHSSGARAADEESGSRPG